MSQRMQLEAQFPDELQALVNWDAIPVESVGVGRRFLLASAEQPDLGMRPCRFPELSISRHAQRLAQPLLDDRAVVHVSEPRQLLAQRGKLSWKVLNTPDCQP